MNELPTEIELSELTSSPREMHGIYDRSPAGTYCLTPGGHLLRRLKEELRHSAVEHSHWFKAGKPAGVTLPDWQRTISAASPNERAALMKLKMAGRITVKT